MHRNLLHSYTLMMKNCEREIKETLPFTTATKRKKYLGINIPKKTDLYAENYKTMMKEVKDVQIDGEIYHVLGLEESTL